MPELPEVETVAQDLRNAGVVGSKIELGIVHTPAIIATPPLRQFLDLIKGQVIQSISRRGKYLIFSLSKYLTLIVHLRMTGRFILLEEGKPYSKHEHVILKLNNGHELRFHDTRKFGRWYLVYDPISILGKLGPEPLEKSFTWKKFKELASGKTRQLKPLLLNQEFIAGLGNIYVDEALWEAKLNPLRKMNTLNENELRNLYHAIQTVLKRGLEAQGTTLGSGRTNFYRLSGGKGSHQHLLKVFRRTGQPCFKCKTKIARIVVAQRSTHFCPCCQSLSTFQSNDR